MLGSDPNFSYYGDINKMAEDTGQSRPALFGFNTTYPPQNQEFDWNRTGVAPYIMGATPSFPNPVIESHPMMAQQQHPQMSVPFGMLSTVTPTVTQARLMPHAGFPFGSSSTTGPIVTSSVAPTRLEGGFSTSLNRPSMRCKRKTDSPPLQKAKQFITEEKMAEHMSKLQINSETQPRPSESDSEKTVRLYMCEQMRQLQSESILPHSILSSIQRPCTALVLWQPPQQRLLQHPTRDRETEPENNNEDSVPDHNRQEADSMDMDNL